jgi:hypothetical protein
MLALTYSRRYTCRYFHVSPAYWPADMEPPWSSGHWGRAPDIRICANISASAAHIQGDVTRSYSPIRCIIIMHCNRNIQTTQPASRQARVHGGNATRVKQSLSLRIFAHLVMESPFRTPCRMVDPPRHQSRGFVLRPNQRHHLIFATTAEQREILGPYVARKPRPTGSGSEIYPRLRR